MATGWLNDNEQGKPLAPTATAGWLGDVRPAPQDTSDDSEDGSLALGGDRASVVNAVHGALIGQESGGNDRIGNSVNGAVGPGQMMPATFARFARPGERIDNPADNRKVSRRYVDYLYDRAGGDPAKMAAGYFSGDGNIGTDRPYKQDYRDGNGKSVSSYVADVMGRLGQAQGQEAPAPSAAFDGPTWAEVSARPAFQSLRPEHQDVARGQYFDRYVAPGIASGQQAAARGAFMQQSRAADYQAPGLVDDVVSGFKTVGTALHNAFDGDVRNAVTSLKRAWSGNGVMDGLQGAKPDIPRNPDLYVGDQYDASKVGMQRAYQNRLALDRQVAGVDRGAAARALEPEVDPAQANRRQLAKDYPALAAGASGVLKMGQTALDLPTAAVNATTAYANQALKLAGLPEIPEVGRLGYAKTLEQAARDVSPEQLVGHSFKAALDRGQGTEWVMSQLNSQAPLMATVFAAATMGGPAAGAGVFAGHSFTEAQVSNREEGYGRVQSAADAFTKASIAAVMGSLPLGTYEPFVKWVDTLPLGAKGAFLSNLKRAAAAGVGTAAETAAVAVQMTAMQIGDNLSEQAHLGKDTPTFAHLDQAVASGMPLALLLSGRHMGAAFRAQGRGALTPEVQAQEYAKQHAGQRSTANDGYVDENGQYHEGTGPLVDPTQPAPRPAAEPPPSQPAAPGGRVEPTFGEPGETPPPADGRVEPTMDAPAPAPQEAKQGGEAPDGHEVLAATLQEAQQEFVDAYRSGDKAKYDALRQRLTDTFLPLLGPDKTADYVSHLVDEGGLRDGAGISHPLFNEAGNAFDALQAKQGETPATSPSTANTWQASPFAPRIEKMLDELRTAGLDDWVKLIEGGVRMDAKGGKLDERGVAFREQKVAETIAAKGSEGKPLPPVKIEPMTPEKLAAITNVAPTLPKPIVDAAVARWNELAPKLAQLGYHHDQVNNGHPPEVVDANHKLIDIANALNGLAARRYQHARGHKNFNPDSLQRDEDFASQVLGIDTRAHPGIDASGQITLGAGVRERKAPPVSDTAPAKPTPLREGVRVRLKKNGRLGTVQWDLDKKWVVTLDADGRKPKKNEAFNATNLQVVTSADEDLDLPPMTGVQLRQQLEQHGKVQWGGAEFILHERVVPETKERGWVVAETYPDGRTVPGRYPQPKKMALRTATVTAMDWWLNKRNKAATVDPLSIEGQRQAILRHRQALAAHGALLVKYPTEDELRAGAAAVSQMPFFHIEGVVPHVVLKPRFDGLGSPPGERTRVTAQRYENGKPDRWQSSNVRILEFVLHNGEPYAVERLQADHEMVRLNRVTALDAAPGAKPKTEKEAKAKRAKDKQPATDAELGAMFDDAMAEEDAKAKPKTEKEAKAKRAKKKQEVDPATIQVSPDSLYQPHHGMFKQFAEFTVDTPRGKDMPVALSGAFDPAKYEAIYGEPGGIINVRTPVPLPNGKVGSNERAGVMYKGVLTLERAKEIARGLIEQEFANGPKGAKQLREDMKAESATKQAHTDRIVDSLTDEQVRKVMLDYRFDLSRFDSIDAMRKRLREEPAEALDMHIGRALHASAERAPASDADLGAMFDDIMAEEDAKAAPTPSGVRAGVQHLKPPPNEESAQQNAKDVAQAKRWGFTDDTVPVGKYGYVDTVFHDHVKALQYDNNKGGAKHIEFNVLVAQGPNGKWAMSTEYRNGWEGSGSHPGIYRKPFDSRDEAVAAGVAELKQNFKDNPAAQKLVDQQQAPAKQAKAKREGAGRMVPMAHPDLADTEVRRELAIMADEAGWEQIGGRMIREDANDQRSKVVGRTPWIAKHPWYAMLPERLNEQDTHDAVGKALAGLPMSAKEKRVVANMIDLAKASNAEREAWSHEVAHDMEAGKQVGGHADAVDQRDADIPFDAIDPRLANKNNLTDEEIDGIFGIKSQRGGVHEKADATHAGQGVSGTAAPAPAGSGAGFDLVGETPEEVKAKGRATEATKAAERKAKATQDAKAKAEQEQKDIRARGDAAAENFTLGEDPEAALSGQKSLLDEPRPLGEAAASAAINSAKALDDAIDGLGKLFSDPGSLGSGPVLNEETYARAKPLFKAAIAHLKDAWTDIMDVMRAVVRMVREKFGPEVAVKMRDYVVRFIKEEQDALAASKHTEPDRGDDHAAPPGDQGTVPNGTAGADGATGKAGGSAAGKRNRPAAGEQLPDAGADAGGTGRGDPVSEPGGKFGLDQHDPESGDDAGSGGTGAPGAAAPDAGPTGAVSADDAARHVKTYTTTAERLALQKAVDWSAGVKVGDKADIERTLPLLFDGQREDVHFAEQRLMQPKGYGVLFANGTGTGKTYLSLGVIKRMIAQGKGNGVIVVPGQDVMNEWLASAPNLGIDLHVLDDTQDMGRGVSITTYANFGSNRNLLGRDHDFVVADEAHFLMSNQDATPTRALETLRAITLHPESPVQRVYMLHPDLVDGIDALRAERDALRESNEVMTRAAQARLMAIDRELEPLEKQYRDKLDIQRNHVQAQRPESRPRLLAVSATPFAWEPNIQWAHGFLLEYPRGSNTGAYNAANPYQQYMIQHFGYQMRNGKLNKPDAKVDRELMQIQWNMHMRQSGVMSTRMLDVDRDYDRKFILVDGGIGARIDNALGWLREAEGGRYSQFFHEADNQFDFLTKSRLLEAIKAKAAVDIIKQHHALGRKVVVFHDFNVGGGFAPFNFGGDPADVLTATDGHGTDAKQVTYTRGEFLNAFRAQFPDLMGDDLSKLKSPIETLREAFPQAMINNGTVSKKVATAAVADFNDDSKPHANLLVVQSAKNAGWSGHDKTGKHMRVSINLGLPTAPVRAIQLEGRTYRVGQMSDAPMRYMNTGTTFERHAFALNISARASTAENLAMGDFARNLKASFIEAFQESEVYPPGAEDGIGGKERDRRSIDMNAFRRAKTYYFGQQKKTARTKSAEGADYFATPEPLGVKMVEWLHAKPGEHLLEPSAGHGAIARWFPENTKYHAIEPSMELSSRLALMVDPKSVITDKFEEHNAVNKYDGIAMNPPFGTGGKLAMEHVAKAFSHLKEGGRVVAIIPNGPAMDKRLNDWLTATRAGARGAQVLVNPDAKFMTYVTLPPSTFARAGTGVATRVVIIDRVRGANDGSGMPVEMASTKAGRHEFDINQLFDYIEHMEMPPRTEPTPAAEGGRVVDNPDNATFRLVGNKIETDAPATKVTTSKGKVLDVVMVPDRAMAKQVDPFTWKPAGQDKFVVRTKYIVRPKDDGGTLQDIPDDARDQLTYVPFTNAPEPKRVATVAKLKQLQAKREAGKMTDAEFALAVSHLIADLQERNETKRERKAFTERERGELWVRERLLRARRKGELDPEAVEFALWALDQNPALAHDLGISIRGASARGSAGEYNPYSRVITLFTSGSNDHTAVHEILHHTERMMPEEVRDGIARAYGRQFAKVFKAGDKKMQAALADLMLAAMGDGEARERAQQAFRDGTLDYDKHYQFANASEFWAVNATDILSGRFGAQGSWVARARQWLRELWEQMKGWLGLDSQSAVLKGLKAVFEGDGTRLHDTMLSQATSYEVWKKMRDGYSPYVGVEVEKLNSTPIGGSLRKLFAPTTRGPGATEMAGIVRANLGEQARERELALKRLKEFAAMFDRLPVADSYQFIDLMENGQVHGTAVLNQAASALRNLLDERRDAVIALGKGQLENFNANYFPHIWKQRRSAMDFFGRRSLEGKKDFLKQRTYDTFADGLAAGLTPITTNPVELALLKAREMDRYIYGQRIFAEMKKAGMAKFVRFGAKAPAGWVKIDDKIAKVRQYSAVEGGFVDRGDYYAPEQAATLINNHLSKGLVGNGAFDLIRSIGNMMNAVQLGLGAFHLGFTTMDAMISRVALGFQEVSRGDIIRGAGNIALGVSPAQPFLNLYKGDRLLRAYLGKLNDPDMLEIVDALMAGGGRIRMDEFYRNTAVNAFKQALRTKRYGEATFKFLPRVLDLVNKPIFEWLVPRQKLGVFFDMASDALQRNPTMTLQEKRAVMAKLWDSVDNRMGEMVYDNVFWNRAFKDGLHVLVRSVGWNFGTFRELGGGVADAFDIQSMRREGLSPRTGYILGLVFLTAMAGAIMQYLYTGEGPKEPKDLFFPRDGGTTPSGAPSRKSLPSYMKDVYEYGHDISGFLKYGANPTNTLQNKMHPLLSFVGDVLQNENFYGEKIRSPGDPALKQLQDEAAFFAQNWTPFSIRSYQQQQQAKGEEGSLAGYVFSPSFIGIVQAPGYITKTDEQIESEQVALQMPGLMKKFRQEFKTAEDKAEVVRRMHAAGMTPSQMRQVMRESNRPYAVPRAPKEFGR